MIGYLVDFRLGKQNPAYEFALFLIGHLSIGKVSELPLTLHLARFIDGPTHFKEKKDVVYSFACVPSQNEPLLEFLHPHQATVLASVTCSMFGAKLEPLCEPSQ